MNKDEYNLKPPFYDQEAEALYLQMQDSPGEELKARAYKLVTQVKEIEKLDLPMLSHFINWIMSAENRGAQDPYLAGIKKWYREFIPEVFTGYDKISDYEIDTLFKRIEDKVEVEEPEISMHW